MSGPAPLGEGAFSRLIACFEPFEERPHLAVAFSGGADSTALLILARDWAKSRGGHVSALTVDHRLRPESAAESRQAGRRAAMLGAAHHILVWRGAKPETGIQAAAREARYTLLEEWCRTNGVLHLLLAHHRDDQIETVVMRHARGSGPDGLAGMAAVIERRHVRVLRPLLTVPKGRLIARLQKEKIAWIEDPSNRDPAFGRVRVRAALADERAMSAGRARAVTTRDAGARAGRDERTAVLLARCAAVDAAGFVRLDRRAWRRGGAEDARRALQRILLTTGGGMYPPRRERLERLFRALFASGRFAGATLAGCRIAPLAAGAVSAEEILICRELAAASAPVAPGPNGRMEWDGRYRVGTLPRSMFGLRLGALGENESFRLGASKHARPGARWAMSAPTRDIPAPVRPSLPALLRHGRPIAVLVPGAPGMAASRRIGSRGPFTPSIVFRPRHPLAGPRFPAIFGKRAPNKPI